MVSTMFKYVKKINKGSGVHTFVPPAFKKRADDLEKCAFELRHGEPAYSTKIKWGTCDLILERKLKSHPSDRYRAVTVKDLPPVDLSPPPPMETRLPNPSSSPAPGRRNRQKRPRSITPTHSSPTSKTSRQEDPTQFANPGLFRLECFRSPAAAPSPIYRKTGSTASKAMDF